VPVGWKFIDRKYFTSWRKKMSRENDFPSEIIHGNLDVFVRALQLVGWKFFLEVKSRSDEPFTVSDLRAGAS